MRLLDQTQLPGAEVYVTLTTIREVVDAMKRLVVRGAPALGCAAAYAMALELPPTDNVAAWLTQLKKNACALEAARPTAVNLGVGVRLQLELGHGLAASGQGSPATWTKQLVQIAQAFHFADQESCLALSEHAQGLLHNGVSVLTHCNAGALATGGIGTALGPLHLAHSRGVKLHVYADETRPLRQGTRLTAWELARHGIAVSVLPDSAAATLLAQGKVDLVFVGSDRIAANGDVANKLGTYPLAVLAQKHGIPFYVLAPGTTIDPACPNGSCIPIEQRDAAELYDSASQPEGVDVFNPAFDITPAELVSAIITEQGLFQPHGPHQGLWLDYVNSFKA
ncbi:MAG: S-methyl-5-thioribose-1-phosphate isomerase [Planctomycetota bacterium]|nr:S-methyl-5-thioribose-1-phosphate isomerase [Planctomycetota bacterium]MDA1112947.1 S-methyl-5-thioribose-1-phosphate isomerase [Planctomycetota bacterium]